MMWSMETHTQFFSLNQPQRLLNREEKEKPKEGKGRPKNFRELLDPGKCAGPRR